MAPRAKSTLKKTAGAGVLLFSLWALAAFFGYDPADSSWNNRGGSGAIRNFLGLPGAYVADLLRQWTGFLAPFLLVSAALWGARILLRRPAS